MADTDETPIKGLENPVPGGPVKEAPFRLGRSGRLYQDPDKAPVQASGVREGVRRDDNDGPCPEEGS